MTTEITSYEPATGQTLWTGEIGDIDQEVAFARQSAARWALQPISIRTASIRRFADQVTAQSAKLADTAARETGKPIWEALAEVEAILQKIDLSIKACSERTSPRTLEGAMGLRSAIRYKPHGVLAVITAFNMPAYLPISHIIPALLAGNAIVFKPSEKAPATGALLVDLFHDSGLDEGLVRLVIGGGDEGSRLASHNGIDGLLFTGSARTGITLNRQLAIQPGKIIMLEMGGNNPIVVWDPPDLNSAAVMVVQSAFMTAGQQCAAARRLILHNSIADAFLNELRILADRLIVGDPHASPSPYMGPVIDNESADRLTESFLVLMSNRGRVVRYITRPDRSLPFLTPGIIDVTEMKERPDVELFGPLLQVVRVETFEEAIAEANKTSYGLTSSLIGGTSALYDQFWTNIRAGVINWNRPTTGASLALPCGGIGISGNDRPGAYYATDYCAYPVSSSETGAVRASIGVGLHAAKNDTNFRRSR